METGNYKTYLLELATFNYWNSRQQIVRVVNPETVDDFIADLAVAVNSDFIKAGAPSRGERISKYNRLLEIAADLK